MSIASAAPRAPALEGIAISLCDNSERTYLRAIEKLTNQSIPCTDLRLTATRRKKRPRRVAAKPQGRSAHRPDDRRGPAPSRHGDARREHGRQHEANRPEGHGPSVRVPRAAAPSARRATAAARAMAAASGPMARAADAFI